jgi:serine/threonine-protein kinase HipA
LLPEGESRNAIARDVRVSASDTYGLIRALGRDCAGALVIQPADDPAPLQPKTTTSQALDAKELEELVRNLRTAPLGVSGRVRISLAGVQEKLVLTRRPDGAWGSPIDGTPSTHILKPEVDDFPKTVENEAFCMRFAKKLGLQTAEVEVTQFGDRKLIVVARYDRTVYADGSVDRIHQEDFCQVFGLSPEKKYEEDGGPSLRRIAGVLAAVGAPDSLERLLSAVTVDVIIGNGDAHAKNFSLLHQRDGTLTLAPLYDLLSTTHYGDDHLAMFIDNVHKSSRVTPNRLINEAATWGLNRERGEALVYDLLERSEAAVDEAAEQTDGLPDQLVTTVKHQLSMLRGSKEI